MNYESTKFGDLDQGLSKRQAEGSFIFSPIGNREPENDPDIWLETGLLGFLMMVVALVGYGLWVFAS